MNNWKLKQSSSLKYKKVSEELNETELKFKNVEQKCQQLNQRNASYGSHLPFAYGNNKEFHTYRSENQIN